VFLSLTGRRPEEASTEEAEGSVAA
jgi:hypothetical protein